MTPREFEEALFPSDVAMSPTFALARFNLLLAKYSKETVLSDVRFKKAREIWLAAAFLLGVSKATGKEWWVLPEHVDQTPDAYGLAVSGHPTRAGSRVQEKMSIEITEWEEHAEEGLAEAIIRKLKGKSYPPYYFLLVAARKAGEMVNLDEVSDVLSRAQVSVAEIWITGEPAGTTPGRERVAIRVFPERMRVEYDMHAEANRRTDQKEMVRFSRGPGDEDHLIDEAHVLPLRPLE